MHIILGKDFANSLLHLVDIRRNWTKAPRKYHLPYSDLKSAGGKNLRLLISKLLEWVSLLMDKVPPQKNLSGFQIDRESCGRGWENL